MVMEVVNVRLPKSIINQIDILVEKGIYSSKSDFIRDVARQRLSKQLDELIGIIPDNGVDSVKEVKEIRKKLSKEKFDLAEINKLAD